MKPQTQPKLGQKPTIIQGGLETKNYEEVEGRVYSLRIRSYQKIKEAIQAKKDEILATEDPIDKFSKVVIEAFCDEVTFEGEENVPERGKLVVAPNHPFGSPDTLALTRHLSRINPNRPWNVAGNINMHKYLVPEFAKDPRFLAKTTPVLRDMDENIRNGENAIFSALSFLNGREDPMFTICPEGHTVTFQNRIGMPFRGFAAIARATRAQIVPVLFTGSTDLEKLRYRIHGKILPPFEPSKDDKQTSREWHMRLRAAALGCD